MSTHEPPGILDETAKQKWLEVLALLESKGGDVDQPQLDAAGCYCAAYSRWADAEARVKELGSVIKSPNGFAIESPYVKIAERAGRAMKLWGDVLGLHKKPKPQATEPADEGGFLRLLRGGKAG